MRAPGFWTQRGGWSELLLPLALLTGAVTRTRWRRARPQRVPVPVVCVGNLVVGGAGKTPLTRDLVHRLRARGRTPHVLIRGYKGRLTGPLRVDPDQHTAEDVGDEALVLAAYAPTWIGGDRVASGRAAVAAGADVLVMDDGFQNPGLAKDLSVVVVDGHYGLGNGRVLPAGPLREPARDGLGRAQAVVIMTPEGPGLARRLRRHLPASAPILEARLVPNELGRALSGQRVVAFAGIGHPDKFFRALQGLGCQLLAVHPFADHYPYAPTDLSPIAEEARNLSALLVTTAKDAARLTPEWRAQVRVLEVEVDWGDPAAPEALLDRLTNRDGAHAHA